MRFRPSLALALLAGAALATPATAAVPHTVMPGETLWSIATADGFDPSTIAAYNGMSEASPVVLGATVQIPASWEATMTPGVTSTPTTSASTTATTTAASSTGAPPPMGGYLVQPGDTLSGLAARSGVSLAQMAAINGLPADAHIIAGTGLKLPTGSPVPTTPATTQSVSTPVTPAAPAAAPHATPTTMDSSQIGSIASANGVSPSLTAAVAWQESGFNNSEVSSTGARGVMQVMPGTWDWVEQNLAGPLDPNSASDNVRAGSLYLGRLLRDTGGDVRKAVAGYYQGLGSVQRDGPYTDTQRYVDNVLALQGRFGG
ncbi:MAG TPA: transglycosylase SLT domain-containing protein [Solirubrobacteraceae bacterium]|jgi:soluble lytic murein transglycosylase-like protein